MFSGQGSQTFTMNDAPGNRGVHPPEKKAQEGMPEDNQACLPVTVRSIEVAKAQRTDADDLCFFGTSPAVLIVVGIAESVVQQTTNLELQVNDGTGRIKARLYLTELGQREKLKDIVPGRYVSMFGGVRTAPEFHFAAMGIRVVVESDEISYHAIEAAHAALKLLKAHKRALEPTTPNSKQALPAAPAGGRADNVSPPKALEPARAATSPGEPMKPLSGAGLKSAIQHFLQRSAEASPEGAHFSKVADHVFPTPLAEVQATLRQLVVDGEIFNTIDDDHFSCV